LRQKKKKKKREKKKDTSADLLMVYKLTAWFIPPEWLSDASIQPFSNITHAARAAAELANTVPRKHLSHSSIPLITHQTWKSTQIDQFPDGALAGIESWLQYAVHPELPNMAYFMWNDEGMMDLMNEADTELLEYFDLLPDFVEKTDVFRVVVCNTIGGVVSRQA
jgi:mannosyltransferase OCH1-like enzyme